MELHLLGHSSCGMDLTDGALKSVGTFLGKLRDSAATWMRIVTPSYIYIFFPFKIPGRNYLKYSES